MHKINWPEVGACIVMAAIVLFLFSVDIARGQAHHHPPQDEETHLKFYRHWMMPDNRAISCCHERDCYPTEARRKNGVGQWQAKRREDGVWLSVPETKIERERDNPDGRNHLCAPPPGAGDTVYCFIIGGAI